CRDESSPAQPQSRTFEQTRLLPDLPEESAGQERRELGLGQPAEELPELLVIFAFHILHKIEVSAPLKVAFGRTGKIDIYTSGASRKPSSCRIRVGWRILRKAFASICRIRSRVTRNWRPTSSSVRLYPSTNPNRCSSTWRSRSVRVSSTSLIFSFNKTMAVISLGFSAPLSSINSPKFVSSLSPTGLWSVLGRFAIFKTPQS